MEFEAFQKIPRLSRECTITEKIDGTNAQILIEAQVGFTDPNAIWQKDGVAVYAGSRSRFITPADDNFGFAKWVYEHAEELAAGLGFGRHYGEWWGSGIGRRYGMEHKRFSLFNVGKWTIENTPECCDVVPTIYNGLFMESAITVAMMQLANNGSFAKLGFMQPEGIIIYHHAANQLFKKTLDKDEEWKGKSA